MIDLGRLVDLVLMLAVLGAVAVVAGWYGYERGRAARRDEDE